MEGVMRDKIFSVLQSFMADVESDIQNEKEESSTINNHVDAILALEVEGKKIHCPDTGTLMVCIDCENKHDTAKCKRPATIGDLIGS